MIGTIKEGNYARKFLLSVICCTCFLFLTAQANNQPGESVTLKANNIALYEVFKAIFKQTRFKVSYANALFDDQKKVNVDFDNAPLSEVMDYLLEGKRARWTLNGKVIIISKAPENAASKNEADSSITNPSLNGRVTDAAGSPLIGATVVVKGTSNGTTTDTRGSFTLPNVKNNSSLVISMLGYETRELLVKGKSILAQLPVVVNELDETIVIAYGTTTQRYSTGNIGSVKAKDIAKQPVNNPLLALQGRVPGLFITQSNGVPGGGVTVRIQGQNSIGNGNDPLYVVDGVPYISQMLATTTGGFILGRSGGIAGSSGQGNPLNYINPADIESIEVLKDADATAIYGSRAANGAILITTKKGKAGPVRVDVNLQHGWGSVTRKLDLMNTQQYLQMRREALKNDEISSPAAGDYDINGTWDTTRYTDWQKALMGGTAHYSNINANISGGSSTVQYAVGGTYHRETLVIPGNFSDKKGSVHFNINATSPQERFRIQLSGNYLTDNNQLPLSDLTSTALSLAPNAPGLYNDDGSLNWAQTPGGNSTWRNPLAFTLQTYDNKTNNLIANTVLSYEVISGLEIRSSFGYNRLQTEEVSTYPLISNRPEQRPASVRAATYSNSTSSSWIVEPQLSYKRKFQKSKLEILLGSTFQQRNENGQELSGTGYNSDAVLKDIRAAANITVNNSVASTYKYTALFGRINYILQDRYILNLSARRDGSSRFGARNRFHNFGAIGGGWIFSEEEIFKNGSSFLSFGKLRGSYGTTGNDQIQDYRYLDLYDPILLGVPYQGGTGLIANRLSNMYLQWEETRKLQFGLDLGFFKERINLTTNYVHNRSSNQLLDYLLPSTTGFTGVTTNFPATVQNTAWEFTLNTKNITSRDFKWSTNLNLTIPRNKLKSFPNLATSVYADMLIEGQSLGVIKAYHYLGVDPATGIYQFADINGKSTTTPDPLRDKTVLINTFPKYYGGIENSFNYKGFQLDILFQFVKQTSPGYRFGNGLYPPGRRNANQPVDILDRWVTPGDIASVQRYTSNLSAYEPYLNAQQSDAYYEDASYIRLKNLSLSYQLPSSWKNKVGLTNCNIYIQGQNLLTFTGYSGPDPETLGSPPLRVLTVGLQAGL